MVSGLLLAPQCSLDYSEIALQCSPDPAIATFLSVLVFVKKIYKKFVDLKVFFLVVSLDHQPLPINQTKLHHLPSFVFYTHEWTQQMWFSDMWGPKMKRKFTLEKFFTNSSDKPLNYLVQIKYRAIQSQKTSFPFQIYAKFVGNQRCGITHTSNFFFTMG